MKKRPDLLIDITLLILTVVAGFFAFYNNIQPKNTTILKTHLTRNE